MGGQARGVRIAVKYCGGCNPDYDAQAAKAAIEAVLGRELPLWSEGAPPEVCLLVKQCRSDCFAHPEQFSTYRTYLLERENEIPRVGAAILEGIRELERRQKGREE